LKTVYPLSRLHSEESKLKCVVARWGEADADEFPANYPILPTSLRLLKQRNTHGRPSLLRPPNYANDLKRCFLKNLHKLNIRHNAPIFGYAARTTAHGWQGLKQPI
jgi:hypothetical protein